MQLDFDGTITLDTLITSCSVLVAIVTFVVTHIVTRHRDRKVANREIYQQLELASNELFRFEGTNKELTVPLWDNNAALPPEKTPAYNAFMNYVCQILNLFEMAIRFRREHIMPVDAFGSWVTWYYDVCSQRNFAPLWQTIRFNYTRDLRTVIDHGVALARQHATDSEAGRVTFFAYVAKQLNCPVIRDWLKESAER